MKRVLLLVLIGSMALEVGCSKSGVKQPSSPPLQSKVSYQAVADKNARHYSVTSSETIVNPEQMPQDSAPEYPPSLVARNLPPMVVQAMIVVDAEGCVTRVEFASNAQGDLVRSKFDAAVRKAVSKWRFTPLRIATWAEDDNGNSHRIVADPKPFSQTYRFRFEILNGKPVVRTGTP